ncbi:MAG: terminase family protein [Thermoplasmata archaeon]
MRCTEIPSIDEFYDRIALSHTGGKFKFTLARDDPSIFATYILGLRGDKLIRPYQDYIFRAILNNKRVAIVKARQLGVSTAIAIFALWAAWFNKFPSSVNSNTKIAIISRGEDSAKKLLNQYIYSLMDSAALFLKQVNPNFSIDAFIKEKNKEQIVFRKNLYGLADNSSYIKSLPPTDKIRGLDLDLVIVDEAAFLNHPDPDYYLKTSVLPTVVSTNGRIVLISTPNGVGNFFYEVVDPEDRRTEHEYCRLFFPYLINKSDENYMRNVNEHRRIMNEYEFKQEYECDFISSGSNFFDINVISKYVDDRVLDSYDGKTPVVVGIDLGWQNSLTVIVVVYRDPSDSLLKLVYLHRFDPHTTNDIVMEHIKYLEKVYNIGTIVVDNCMQAKDFINELKKQGYNVREFDFHKEKVPAYVRFKQLLNLGMLRYPNHPVLIDEMKGLVKEETSIGIPSIHKSAGFTDDVIDALVMAVYMFKELENESLQVDFIL